VISRPPVFLVALTAILLCGCGLSHGRPTADSETVAPGNVLDFSVLFSQNCAGCHGVEGKGSAAIALSNPEYLALADDATILQVVSHGRAGTPMSAFAKAAGGMLTEKQISVIVAGMRKNWGRSTPAASVALPPYAARSPGNPQAGSQLFQTFCGSCHGANTPNGDPSILNPSFLALVSDQYLRTIVIGGRPELNAPDFRGNLPGQVMSDQEITDIVAWLSSQRTSTKLPNSAQSSAAVHLEHPAREGASDVHR
jgi:cytochrome c oxidase cbb3-type subunit 3